MEEEKSVGEDAADDFDEITGKNLPQFPVDGRHGHISALPMGGGLPPKNCSLEVPDEVPVKIGDQTIGVAKTKRVPDGIEFEMRVDWVDTKRGWIHEHLAKPLLPAGFSFDYNPPERFLMARPYVEASRLGSLNTETPLPIGIQIPSRNGGDELLAVNPDWHSIYEAKPGEPRPEPEPEEKPEKGQQPA